MGAGLRVSATSGHMRVSIVRDGSRRRSIVTSSRMQTTKKNVVGGRGYSADQTVRMITSVRRNYVPSDMFVQRAGWWKLCL